MTAYEIITKKKRGIELSDEEIRFLLSGFLSGEIPDYQVSAWCMAVYFKGMTYRETFSLTMAMVESGRQVDLSQVPGVKVDKHSTGGVGDKTTLVLAPLVASCGAKIAKMSGRGLGHTGGTLDKLESIPGFRVDLTMDEFIANVKRTGIAVASQTADLVPADKKLYGLRDVTATVDSIPLIASSIMSKKIAAGADSIVLDVKVGSGAFMKSEPEAYELARTMVEVGRASGRKVAAFLTDMSQPLGRAVGNALELREAIETLSGGGPPDLVELCTTLGGQMLAMAGIAGSLEEGRHMAMDALASGRALDKFRAFVEAQGGDSRVVEDPDLLGRAPHEEVLKAWAGGWIGPMDTENIGMAALALGAGRRRKDEPIDRSVGIVFMKKTGDRVAPGEPIAAIHARDKASAMVAGEMLARSISIAGEEVEKPRLVRDLII
ncbi:MAG TPA: pyrimidine-nucleoside phosphorylase [Firmicutes bacterium]|nr:pyrimidine-nucleoside phosphorylase [Bacillota bacterium]